MRIHWTTRRSNQSILKKSNPEYSLEELMLTLNLQYFGHLMERANSLGKTLMLRKTEAKEEGSRDVIINSVDMKLGELQEMVRNREAWSAEVHGVQRIKHDSATEQQQYISYLPESSV